MGKLERLNKLRFGRDEILFIVLSVLVYFLSSRLPKSILADVCLGASVAVKVVGLPDQLRKMAKNGDVSSQSLLRNVIDYQSYVLWALYAQAIHSPVLFWGQFPGALLVWLITLFHIRKGDFPWKRVPDKLGHVITRRGCRQCAYVDLNGRSVTDRRLTVGTYRWPDQITEGEAQWPRRCKCGGWQHAFEVFPRPYASNTGKLHHGKPGLKVRCSSCDHALDHADYCVVPASQRLNPDCCWYCSSSTVVHHVAGELDEAGTLTAAEDAALWLAKRGSRPAWRASLVVNY